MTPKHNDSLATARKPRQDKGWLFRGISIALMAGTIRFLVIPLITPRGLYGWGHYTLTDLAMSALVLLCAGFLYVNKSRNATGEKVFLFASSLLITAIVADSIFTLGIRQAWRNPHHTDVWFNRTGVTHLHNDPDEELGFVRKPNISWEGKAAHGGHYVYYRTDRNGFRNPPGVRQAPVVFVGDSFTEAASVPEELTFAAQVGKILDTSVVNLGRGNYGPQQELIVLERYGLSYSPDWVIWQFFEGNDLSDAHRYRKWRDATPYQRESLSLRYAKSSPLVRALSFTIPKDFLVPRQIRHSNGSLEQIYLDYRYQPRQLDDNPLGLSETAAALKRGQELAGANGFELLVVFIPIKVRVLGPYVIFNGEEDRRLWLSEGGEEGEGGFSRALALLCEDIGCHYIDPTEILRRRANDNSRHIYASNEDSHLDTEGHRIIAEELARGLGELAAEDPVGWDCCDSESHPRGITSAGQND